MDSPTDLVPVFSSDKHDAEMETLELQTLLEANGIDSTVGGSATIPTMEFQVLVDRAHLEEAQRVIADAQAAGPEAADEAEAEEQAEREKGTSSVE